MVKRPDECLPGDPEPAAQIIPDRDAELVTGLCEALKGVSAITTEVAPCPSADFPPGDLTADVVLRAVGVEWDFRVIQHHQQLGLVGMQPCQQAIQCGKAGTAAENAVEPGAQRE